MTDTLGITYRGFDISARATPAEAGGFRASYAIEGEDSEHSEVMTERSEAVFDSEDDAIAAALSDARAQVDAILAAQ